MTGTARECEVENDACLLRTQVNHLSYLQEVNLGIQRVVQPDTILSR